MKEILPNPWTRNPRGETVNPFRPPDYSSEVSRQEVSLATSVELRSRCEEDVPGVTLGDRWAVLGDIGACFYSRKYPMLLNLIREIIYLAISI